MPLSACPHCAGELQNVAERTQFIEEIPPVRPLCIKVTTWTGTCAKCGDVESRHPLQTSTATGAAGTHLGPRAHALALSLSHRSGMTMGRTCQALYDLCGLKLTRGGLAQLLQRAGRRMEEAYAGIHEQIRRSTAVYADETSWYVGQPGWWKVRARKHVQFVRGVTNLLARSPPEPEELAFRERLRKQQPHLLGCLSNRTVEPTNNRAERDLRPAVIDRKVSCGNKTPAGARAWEIVRTEVTTTVKQGQDLLDVLTQRMRLAGS